MRPPRSASPLRMRRHTSFAPELDLLKRVTGTTITLSLSAYYLQRVRIPDDKEDEGKDFEDTYCQFRGTYQMDVHITTGNAIFFQSAARPTYINDNSTKAPYISDPQFLKGEAYHKHQIIQTRLIDTSGSASGNTQHCPLTNLPPKMKDTNDSKKELN